MTYKIFIDGSYGTTGLRIYEYLKRRRDIQLLFIKERDRKNIEARCEIINSSDIAFLCLPDQGSREITKYISNNTKILDTSTAYRTDSNWVYGLP